MDFCTERHTCTEPSCEGNAGRLISALCDLVHQVRAVTFRFFFFNSHHSLILRAQVYITTSTALPSQLPLPHPLTFSMFVPHRRFYRSPLHVCALTLSPHTAPVVAPDGVVFESTSIFQLVRRTGLHPLSGRPLRPSDLVALNFSTDPSTGTYRCPIRFTPFDGSIKVIAVATTGRVYSSDVISRLNLHSAHMRDPIDGTPFAPTDLIVLYDPVVHTWTIPDITPHPCAKTLSISTPPQSSTVSLSSSHTSQPLQTIPVISFRRHMPKPTIFPQSVCRPPPRTYLVHPTNPPSFVHSAASLPKPSDPALLFSASAPCQQSASLPIPPSSSVSVSRLPSTSDPQHCFVPVSHHPTVPSTPRTSAILPTTPARRRHDSTANSAPPAKKPRHTFYPLLSHDISSPQAPGALNQADTIQPSSDSSGSANVLHQKRLAEHERKAVYKRIRKGRKGKGYVRVVTNVGHLNIELHCDKVPIACDNFLTLAERGYYDGLLWHKVVPGFIAQTGDPTGVGDAGDSAWGGFVKDEIRTSLMHDSPGIVSMANSGKDTNRSQWFVCFEAARHLDGAHTVFGKVVGGLFVLKKMETEAEMGNPLAVERVEVLVNPVRQIREQMQRSHSIPEKPLSLEAPMTTSLVGSHPSTVTEGPRSSSPFYNDEHGNQASGVASNLHGSVHGVATSPSSLSHILSLELQPTENRMNSMQS